MTVGRATLGGGEEVIRDIVSDFGGDRFHLIQVIKKWDAHREESNAVEGNRSHYSPMCPTINIPQYLPGIAVAPFLNKYFCIVQTVRQCLLLEVVQVMGPPPSATEASSLNTGTNQSRQ